MLSSVYVNRVLFPLELFRVPPPSPEYRQESSRSRRRQHSGTYSYYVPLIVFRFLISLLIEGRAIVCKKSCLPAFLIGKQSNALGFWGIEAHIKA